MSPVRAAIRAASMAPGGSVAAPDPRIRQVGDLRTELLFDLIVDLDAPLDFGAAHHSRRILYGARGGSFRGERLRGEVVAGGGDWATFHAGGGMDLDVRLTLRTHDEALVHMSYDGRWITPAELRGEMADPALRILVDPACYYCRTRPRFWTGSTAYRWLNDVVSVGTGYPVEGGVAYRVFWIL